VSEAGDERMKGFAEQFPPGPGGPEARWRGERGETGKQGPRGEPLTPALRKAVIFLFLLSFTLAGTALFVASHEIGVSARKWCATLDLLTARPVPRPADPAANPSRENAYVFYADISDLRRQFGCG
jgi:hypothetical protein